MFGDAEEFAWDVYHGCARIDLAFVVMVGVEAKVDFDVQDIVVKFIQRQVFFFHILPDCIGQIHVFGTNVDCHNYINYELGISN